MLGPGLVTGASDDDPSGIGTYSQVGAQFGMGLLWTIPFTYPLMCAVQEISARIGRVSGKGIAGNLRAYPRWLMYSIIFLLVIANVINLGADIAAMGAAAKLLLGGPAILYAIALTVVSVLLEVFICYDRYAHVLKWLTLTIFAYVATAFVVQIPWGETLKQTFWPHVSLSADYLTALIAVFGTTISPYLFFWQASQEVEEITAHKGAQALKRTPKEAPAEFWRIRVDTVVGMFFSNIVAFFIILTCAVTLHAHGITSINTAAEAAEALRPVAGRFAFALFAGGIIGTGLLALPVLAGSAAYAVGEAMGWPIGLDKKAARAKGFYAVIAGAMLLGLALNFTSIDPIKALFWSAVINGVTAVPVLVLMMLMANNAKIMGKKFTIPRILRLLGWTTAAVMLAATIAMFATWHSG
ncbi:divalent metal cation transporter [Pseudolysobacter antarcticus]|uniref:Divalent metal cation transporter n=2 Tax=Pseudolysobacter antarcticus TaxID=2511995 RepID=A0A411HQK8_9GAMM|nr:divalent metal cation transporter [Pseudolysobacter antarcticus]